MQLTPECMDTGVQRVCKRSLELLMQAVAIATVTVTPSQSVKLQSLHCLCMNDELPLQHMCG